MAELLVDLLERCHQGDQSAYEVIVKRFQNKALDLAKGLIGDKQLAEDAIQEAFLTAFCRLKQLREPAAFVGWFMQIVRTEALRVIRKESRNQNKVDNRRNGQLSPLEKIELEELRQMVRQALSELSESNRQTAELFYLDEQSCAQVAGALNVPMGTVKRRLYDSRQRMRDILLGYIEEPNAKRNMKRKFDKRMPL